MAGGRALHRAAAVLSEPPWPAPRHRSSHMVGVGSRQRGFQPWGFRPAGPCPPPPPPHGALGLSGGAMDPRPPPWPQRATFVPEKAPIRPCGESRSESSSFAARMHIPRSSHKTKEQRREGTGGWRRSASRRGRAGFIWGLRSPCPIGNFPSFMRMLVWPGIAGICDP